MGGCGRNESIWEDVGGIRVYGRMCENMRNVEENGVV